ncbi:MAG: lysostaphin resistance A-like protein, partial [Acidimicrobiia bacterium]
MIHRPHATTLRPNNAVRWGVTHTVAAYLVGLIVGNLLFTLAGGDTSSATTTVAIHVASVSGLWLGFVGGPLLLTRWLGSGSLRADYGLSIRSIDIPIGIVAGVVTQILVVPAVSWPIEHLWSVNVDEPARNLLDATSGPRLILYFIITIAGPVAEELFFRGLLLRSLARWLNDIGAVTVSALLFALTHYQAAQIPG